MAKDQELDGRFVDAPQNGNGVKLSGNGIAELEDLGDGLVKVTDRDGRVSIFPKDAEPANMSADQRQKAVDAAIDASPVDNELSPGHSDYDPSKSLATDAAEAAGKSENNVVVNKDLGVDKNSNESK